MDRTFTIIVNPAAGGGKARAKPTGDGLFAIIPAGRGNDLARTYGIPFSSNDAAKLLLDGQLCPMDLIEVTGADGTQTSAAGSLYVGIASVAGQIANDFRLIRGPVAYPAAALRALVSWKPECSPLIAWDRCQLRTLSGRQMNSRAMAWQLPVSPTLALG
jgi:diacylglycerol kinase family enzyme